MMGWRNLVAPYGDARTLQVATFLETFGLGLFLTVGVLYFSHHRHLSAGDVGQALTISGILGVFTGIPLGRLADRANNRHLLAAGLVVQALAAAAYTQISDSMTLTAAMCLFVLGEQTAYGARGAIMGLLFTEKERVLGRARMRATNNGAIALGSAVGAGALAVGTSAASLGALLLFAGVLLAAAVWSSKLQLSRTDVTMKRPGPRASILGVLRDAPYMAVVALCSIIAMHAALFEIGMPFWVSDHTTAPSWIVGALVALATMLVLVLQVPLSAGADDVVGAARKQRLAGFLLLAACLLFAAASLASSSAATVLLLLLATIAYVVGEVTQAAGAWGLSYALGDDSRMGEYQAAFGTGISSGARLAPVVVTGVILRFGPLGWVTAGAFLALAATVGVPITTWAERYRLGSMRTAN